MNLFTLLLGDPCTVPATAETGQCTQLDKCEYAKQLLRSNKNPQSCGFQGKAPLVCCPVGPKPGDTSLRRKFMTCQTNSEELLSDKHS